MRFFRILMTIFLIFLLVSSCSDKSPNDPNTPPEQEIEADYEAPKAVEAPTVDGIASEAVWAEADWALLNYLWVGSAASSGDFTGRYKIAWTENKLYLLVEIVDDVLSDVHSNPLENYWDDDCVEFFIDEDASGGDHTYNHNAFAYHIALNYKAIDIGTNHQAQEYTSHIQAMRKSAGSKHTWEIVVDVYNDQYVDGAANNPKVTLEKGKVIGYAMAYCDGDGTGTREHFYGSIDIPGNDKNLAWQNASVFGTLLLIEK